MTSRRAFLRSLLALPIAATFDVEKLLWIPGQMIAVPTTYETVRITLDDVNAVALRMFVPLVDQFFKADPFIAKLKDSTKITFNGHTIEVPIVYHSNPSWSSPER
jgi:hypothetical protein